MDTDLVTLSGPANYIHIHAKEWSHLRDPVGASGVNHIGERVIIPMESLGWDGLQKQVGGGCFPTTKNVP